ncbi:MAG: glutamate--tRNA ligase [Trueperaceae bacterium]|nr:glutamate--tRNA ligase [Trueperaceae bacterium]
MTVVTRIAPSPTGDPHVGTAYVGLFDYVLAKQGNGRFIFRLEDTDRQRYDPNSERRILSAMDWLGLTPDEGPEVGGNNGPYRQSERLDLYRNHAELLLESGCAYRAFETDDELESMAHKQKQLGQPQGYDGRGRNLARNEQERRATEGEPHVIRFKAPDEGETRFIDSLRGEICWPHTEIRDAVLIKSDGYPTYHFAVVVDDHLMGVTHVVRAEEWISSTALHIHLYRSFGWQQPEFLHLPLLRNLDKSKISKRKTDTSLESYREQGIIPEALLNYLATLGWSMPDGREFFGIHDMIEHFTLKRLSPGEPIFDSKRLRHFNAKYLREIFSLENLAVRVEPLFVKAGYKWSDEDYLLDVIDVLRPRTETLIDFVDQARYFFDSGFPYEDDALKRLFAGQKYLEDLERRLSILEFYDYDSIDDLLRDYVQSQAVSMSKVLQPLRAALTGRSQAPGVTDLLTILGKQTALGRISRALQVINAGLLDDRPQKETGSNDPKKKAKTADQ